MTVKAAGTMDREVENAIAFIHTANIPMTIADPDKPDCPLLSANAAFEELTGYTGSSIVGKNCRLLQGKFPERSRTQAIRKAIEDRKPCTVSLQNYRRNGEPFNNLLSLDPVKLPSGKLLYLGCQFEFGYDIQEHDVVTATSQRLDDFTRIQGRFTKLHLDIRTSLQLRAEAAVLSVRNYLIQSTASHRNALHLTTKNRN